VLEIVWAFLYSGRPKQAWAELEKAWPDGDVARAKAAIVEARSRGIESEVANVATSTRPPKWNEAAGVYQFLKSDPAQQSGGHMVYGALGVTGSEGPVFVRDQQPTGLYAADKEPKAISLWRPPPSVEEQALAQTEETVLLTIDEAGKVESARMMAPRSDPALLQAAKNWKFIPASLDEKPVAYRLKMDVQLVR
jgi:outer membrane biosynthesis protein TonB